MSLSPLVSFKSRFVSYLLNFPRTTQTKCSQKTAKRYTKFTVIPPLDSTAVLPLPSFL